MRACARRAITDRALTDWHLTIPMWWCVAAAVVVWLSMLPASRGISGPRVLGAVCGLLTASAFASVWWLRGELLASGADFAYARWPWVPSLGLSVGVYFDGLSALMALLVTGIGSVIMVYAGQYFADSSGGEHRRFLGYLTLFQAAMLGLVMAGDLVLLFVFWELTSVTSFLLIGFKRGDAKARAGAMKSLLITGGGGVALLIGVLMIGHTVGSFEMPAVLAAGDVLRASPVYFGMFALLAVGALTKSAQFPFHGWLPDGMTAPTPASAFLHSATMVKAGVYLLARMNPAMGFTETWFWTLTIAGGITMLLGAFMALRVTDLKAVLAYTTLSQLGVLTMLCGQDTAVAFKALMVGLVAHGLYKSSLFMAVGIIDHECGTRDLDRLGGLWKVMPITGVVVGIAALSMAGLPPMFGYLAKDVLLASASHETLPGYLPVVLAVAVALAGAASLAAAGRIVLGAFFDRPATEAAPESGVAVKGHDPGWAFWLMPAIPAVLSVIVALPALSWVKALAADAAAAAFAGSVDVPLKFWKGFDAMKAVSLGAIALGLVFLLLRGLVRRVLPDATKDPAYAALVWLVDRPAWLATRVQNGQLSRYVLVMLLGIAALWIVLAGTGFTSGALGVRWGNDQPWLVLKTAALLLAGSAALATVVLRRDLQAIFSLGASGLGVALIYLFQPAPDVALVMLVVDVLTVVVLVLALGRVPRAQRQQADRLDFQEKRRRVARDAGVSVAAAACFGMVVWMVLQARDGQSALSPWFMANAKGGAGASDVVGAILVDFRAVDTFIEIAVFALAGVGVYTLVRHAAPTAGDTLEPNTPMGASAAGRGDELFDTPMMRLLAGAVLPLGAVVAASHVMYGHAQPGDGFTAGVILSLAAAVRYVVLGYEATRNSKRWLRPVPLVGAGLTLAMVSAGFALAVNGSFFSHVNFGAWVGLRLPRDFELTTSLLFELAIALSVFGGGTLLVDTLTRPAEEREGAA